MAHSPVITVFQNSNQLLLYVEDLAETWTYMDHVRNFKELAMSVAHRVVVNVRICLHCSKPPCVDLDPNWQLTSLLATDPRLHASGRTRVAFNLLPLAWAKLD